MSAIALTNVGKSRGAGHRAVEVLRSVTFTVDAGEFVLLEGPSGSGKTTLLGVVAGLLSTDAGQVLLAEQPLHRLTPERRRAVRAALVGFVFQRANLLPGLTVRENILLMGRIAGMTVDAAEQEGSRLLDLLSLGPCGGRLPSELSGGEEQRVAVARALVHRPKVVLADEPTGSLDRQAGYAVATALADLARQRGAALLVCTHDARLAPFATRRLALVDGRIEVA